MKMIAIMSTAIVILVVVVTVLASRSAAKPPLAGTPAPEFTLNAQDGKPLSLRDFRGKWVVLYFYPKDFTSGCTKEARNFQHRLAQYEQKNAVIFGISGQNENSHQRFCAAEDLHFKLLADTNFDVSMRYGSVVNLGVAKLSARHTFLIDPQGKIAKVFPSVKPGGHSEEVLAALASLQKQ